jgi:hypothetical protein
LTLPILSVIIPIHQPLELRVQGVIHKKLLCTDDKGFNIDDVVHVQYMFSSFKKVVVYVSRARFARSKNNSGSSSWYEVVPSDCPADGPACATW